MINFYFRLFFLSFFNLFLINSFSLKESSFKKLFFNKNSRNALFSYFTMVGTLKCFENYLLKNEKINNVKIKKDDSNKKFYLIFKRNLNFFGFNIEINGILENLDKEFSNFNYLRVEKNFTNINEILNFRLNSPKNFKEIKDELEKLFSSEDLFSFYFVGSNPPSAAAA